MNVLFLLNGFLFLGIFAFLLINFFKHYTKKTERIARFFSFIGIVYFLFALSSIFWAFGILNYAEGDFLFLYAISLIFQSFILFRVVYLFSKNKRLNYFLIFYLVILASLLVVFHNFLILSIFASFLFTLLLCLEFIFVKGDYRNVGYLGVFYSLISIVLSLFFFYEGGNLYVFSLISNLLFFIFVFIFLRDLEKFPVDSVLKLKKERSYFLSLLSHLIFIITLTNFIFIGTIGIHEFGHYGVSKFYDCDYRKIVYEDDFFHTEILCGDISNNVWVVLGGVLLPLLVALLLFFIGGKFMKEVSILVAGFNFISVSKDLGDLGISENLVFGVIFLGVLGLIFGIFLLAKSRTEEDIYLDSFVRNSGSIKKKREFGKILSRRAKRG